MSSSTKKLTKDECQAYLQHSVFPLRDSDYSEKYPKWPGSIGIEAEVTYLNPETFVRTPLYGKNGTIDCLMKIADSFGWQCLDANGKQTANNQDVFKIAINENEYLTFEPGGQVEFSTRPFPCLDAAMERLHDVQDKIMEALSAGHWQSLYLGLDPWNDVEDVGLQMAKPRYQIMDKYFSKISSYGQRMMRQTNSLQVNLDFGVDDSTLARRYLGAQLLAPIATATFAFSPYMDGKKQPEDSIRARIWQELDKTRTGLIGVQAIAQQTNKLTCVKEFLNFCMRAPVIYYEREGKFIEPGPLSFGDWLAGKHSEAPTLTDFKLHLTLLFPEVRPKGFLEFRSIDGPARAWQNVPAAYVASLIYDEVALKSLIEFMTPEIPHLNELLKKSAFGMQDPALAKLVKQVMSLAIEGVERLPSCYRDAANVRSLTAYNDIFTTRDLTPAAELKNRVDKAGNLNMSIIKDLENYFLNTV